MQLRGVLSDNDAVLGSVSQGKKSILRRSSSDPPGPQHAGQVQPSGLAAGCISGGRVQTRPESDL